MKKLTKIILLSNLLFNSNLFKQYNILLKYKKKKKFKFNYKIILLIIMIFLYHESIAIAKYKIVPSFKDSNYSKVGSKPNFLFLTLNYRLSYPFVLLTIICIMSLYVKFIFLLLKLLILF